MSLFDKAGIKGLELPNRFVRSATWEGLADEDGHVTDRLVDRLTALARGGVGLIIAGFAYVSADGRAAPFQTGIYEDEMVLDLTRLSGLVHAAGGRVGMQIVHGGLRASTELNEVDLPAGPSAVRVRGMKTEARELSTAEIARIVEDFGRAAGRVRESGFDAVQLHGAHGYLLSQFLSPITNQRGDRYGGALENRARIVFEAYEAVRDAVGPDFPVLIKINSEDFSDGGLTLEESVTVTEKLVDLGLDAVEVSGGLGWNKELHPSRTKIDSPDREAYFRTAGAAFKARIKAPVILVGGMRSLEVMEDVRAQSQADFIALCRPLIREPDLIARWAAGDRSPSACVSCNGCLAKAASGNGLACAMLDRE